MHKTHPMCCLSERLGRSCSRTAPRPSFGCQDREYPWHQRRHSPAVSVAVNTQQSAAVGTLPPSKLSLLRHSPVVWLPRPPGRR